MVMSVIKSKLTTFVGTDDKYFMFSCKYNYVVVAYGHVEKILAL